MKFHCIEKVERPIPQDLLPAYLSILARMDPDALSHLHRQFPDYDRFMKKRLDHAWWRGEAYTFMGRIARAIEQASKPGVHFGQGPDDPTEIGFYTPNQE